MGREEFGTIAIIPSQTGTAVTLTDLAEIELGFEEAGFHAQFNQQPSVEIEVFRVGEQSPLETAAAVKSILHDFEQNLLPGIKMRIDSNRAQDYHNRLSLLLKNRVYALIIVSLFWKFSLNTGWPFESC